MALKEMETIENDIRLRWDICSIAMIHRIGRVDIGEASVVIAVSSAHRKSISSMQMSIDTLKKTVPIWKKNTLRMGSVGGNN